MTCALSAFANLSDNQLLAEVSRLAARERQATAELINSLIELDARKLYLGQGCSSLFTYCTQVLHLSEHAAFGRIEVARAARRVPAILDRLLDGSLTVTNARLLAPHLTEANHREVLESARHKSKREVEEIVARLRPLPDVAATVRKLPERRCAAGNGTTQRPNPSPAAAAPAPRSTPPVSAVQPAAPRPIVAPLGPDRYKIQLTVSRETQDKLRRAQDLLRHALPNGDPAEVLDRALTLLVEHLEKQKFAAASKPQKANPFAPGSRHIPAAVRREVWARDEGRCAFVGPAGRCAERGFVEFHHVEPFAAGGEPSVQNIALRCRAHNAFEASLFFGPAMMREAAVPFG